MSSVYGELYRMFRAFRARIQIVLTLFLILAASPLAAATTAAQVATPVTEPEPTVTAPTETPVDGSEQPAARPATGPQDEPAADLQDEGTAYLLLNILACENDARAGQVDFLPMQLNRAASASDTSDNCQPVSLEYPATEIYLYDPATGDMLLIDQPQVEIPAGTFTLVAWIYAASGESSPIEFPAGSVSTVNIVSYVPETPPVTPEPGSGEVQIGMVECVDWDRVGETHFLIGSATQQRSAWSGCTPVDSAATSFTLVNADDPNQVLSPTSVSDMVIFGDVPSGTWYVSEGTSGATSDPFVVSNGQQSQVAVVSYIEGDIDLTIERIVCEDDARAGTTDFLLHSPPIGYSARAATSTCFGIPQTDPVTVTLDNLDTGDSYQAEIVDGAGYLESVTAGTYVVTDSGATSDAFALTGPGRNLRIVSYVAEGSEQPVPEDGFGVLSGTILYCSSPDRAEGEVDFIVRQNSWLRAASTSECDFGGGTTGGMLTLYPADATTGEIDEAAATQLWTDGTSFWQDIIPSGSYVLGYTSPFTGETSLSEVFSILHRTDTIVDINIFSEPAFTTYLDVWMDICVDPARAGTTGFQLITEYQILAVDGSASECRYANPADGEIAYVLTNEDTGQTWNRTITAGDSLTFDNLLAGTYTLSETHNGITQTSAPFMLEPADGIWHWMNLHSFIAEKDWTEPEPGDDVAYIAVFAYGCSNPKRDGGYEWFRYASIATMSATSAISPAQEAQETRSDTSSCITIGEPEGIGFIAEPVDGSGEVYEFFENGPGLFELVNSDGIPAGDYIVTELSTGASSGVVRIIGWTALDLLLFEPQPTSDVSLEIESGDPAVANTLPAGSTWTITSVSDPTRTISGTFGDSELELPVTIPLDEPLPYGDYLVEIDATPVFDFYSQVFTVGPMELASTQLFGLLQQAPEIVTFDIVLQPAQDVSPEPTEPVTPVPTTPAQTGETPVATATTTPETAVTALPSTGNGDAGSGSGLLILAAMFGSLVAAAGAVAVRSKRA